MAVCCCSLAGTAACQHCSANPFATDVWTNKTVTVDHIEAKPFGDGLDVCPVCGKPSTIGKPITNADRIRAMSVEEMAELLTAVAQKSAHKLCESLKTVEVDLSNCNFHILYEAHLDWLKQEVKE